MLDLGALKIKIFADSDAAEKGLKSTAKEVDNVDSKFKKFAGATAGAAKAAFVGIGAAGAAAATSMVAVTAKALETTATIEKFAATCNVSTEEYQRLDGVMQTMGWSMEDAAGDFAALSEKMLEAAQTGEGEAFEMFTKLGVSVEDSNGKLRNTGDVFNDMILGLQNMEDATERQAIASIMLGTTSEELAPLLSMTNEEFKNMKENINVIDQEQLDTAAEFKESWDSLKASMSHAATELGIKLMPLFQELVDWFNEYLPQIQEITGAVFDAVIEIFSKVIEAVGELWERFEDFMEENEELSDAISSTWDTISGYFSTVFKEIQELVSAFIGAVERFFEEHGEAITSIVQTMWDMIKTIYEVAQPIIKGIIDTMTAFLNGDFEEMQDIVTGLVDDMWEGVKKLFSSAIDWIGDLVPKLFGIGADLVQGLWDGWKSIWYGMQDWIKGKCSDMLGSIKGFFGIKSPSRVMMQVGKDLGTGMQIGIEGSTKGVQEATKGMTSEVLDIVKYYSLEYENTMTKGEQKVYDARKEALQNYVSDMKYYNDLTLEEELGFYQGMHELAKDNGEEMMYWDREMYRVRQEIRERDIEHLEEMHKKEREMYLDNANSIKDIITAGSNEELDKLQAELDKMDAEDKENAYNEKYDRFEEQIKGLEKELSKATGDERKRLREQLADKESEFEKWLHEEERKAEREAIKEAMDLERKKLKDKLDGLDKNNQAYLELLDQKLDYEINAVQNGASVEIATEQQKAQALISSGQQILSTTMNQMNQKENVINNSNANTIQEVTDFARQIYNENYRAGANFANGLADGILNQTYRVVKAIRMLGDEINKAFDNHIDLGQFDSIGRMGNTSNNSRSVTQSVNITVNASVRNQNDIDAISRKLQADFTRHNRALGTI